MKPGSIGILNVGAGDTKLVFDPAKPDEAAEAARIVTDMLRRGYAIFVQVGENEKGPVYQRAHDFDAATAEYIIAGTPPAETEAKHAEPESAPRGHRKARALPRQRVAASSTSAVAVARTAGG